LALTIGKVGTGIFKLRMVFEDGSYIEYAQDELEDKYLVSREYKDLLMKNDSQTVENPILIFEWRE